MTLSLIVAVSENGIIGREGQIPWHLSSDLQRFKRLTMGHHLLMGRKTYESLGRPLPGRTMVVLTRGPHWSAPAAVIAHDLEEALQVAGDDPEPFVIGGAQIYQLALPRVDRIYRTIVHATIDGDTKFPELDQHHWQVISQEKHVADQRNQYDCTFQVLERRDPPELSH